MFHKMSCLVDGELEQDPNADMKRFREIQKNINKKNLKMNKQTADVCVDGKKKIQIFRSVLSGNAMSDILQVLDSYLNNLLGGIKSLNQTKATC